MLYFGNSVRSRSSLAASSQEILRVACSVESSGDPEIAEPKKVQQDTGLGGDHANDN